MGSWFGICCCSAGRWRWSTTSSAGLRHLAWDAGYGFDLPAGLRQRLGRGRATGVLTVLIWIVAFVVWR